MHNIHNCTCRATPHLQGIPEPNFYQTTSLNNNPPALGAVASNQMPQSDFQSISETALSRPHTEPQITVAYRVSPLAETTRRTTLRFALLTSNNK